MPAFYSVASTILISVITLNEFLMWRRRRWSAVAAYLLILTRLFIQILIAIQPAFFRKDFSINRLINSAFYRFKQFLRIVNAQMRFNLNSAYRLDITASRIFYLKSRLFSEWAKYYSRCFFLSKSICSRLDYTNRSACSRLNIVWYLRFRYLANYLVSFIFYMRCCSIKSTCASCLVIFSSFRLVSLSTIWMTVSPGNFWNISFCWIGSNYCTINSSFTSLNKLVPFYRFYWNPRNTWPSKHASNVK